MKVGENVTITSGYLAGLTGVVTRFFRAPRFSDVPSPVVDFADVRMGDSSPYDERIQEGEHPILPFEVTELLPTQQLDAESIY